MRMNWDEYRRFVDEKLEDAWNEWTQAEMKAKEAWVKYDAILTEKKSFETAMDELMEGKSNELK